MEFHLTYQGPLKANDGPIGKHRIRKYIEPQLRKLWDMPPLKESREKWLSSNPEQENVSIIEKLKDLKFAPLVTSELDLICHLDILLLWPDQPGKIIGSGGDIDNRLKTLFDALTYPDDNQIKQIKNENGWPDIFFCLLQDDKLITSINVKADR